MKTTLIAISIALFSLSASAQRRPRLPIPPVNVGHRCTVLMIDNWHRTYQTFSGRTDIFSGQCRTPMNQCRRALPRRRNLRCVERNGRW